MDKKSMLEELGKKCAACSACGLCKTRKNCVFGAGSPYAGLMFVGEAPGEREDMLGIPFVGKAGQLLDKFLFAADISREEVYITNILKCRPPQNRDPLPEEEDMCMDFLKKQIGIIRPKILVCLGRIAATRLIKPDYKVTAEHGVWTDKGDYIITAIYHPAALLRDPRKKEDMLTDMKKIKAKLDFIRSSPGASPKS